MLSKVSRSPLEVIPALDCPFCNDWGETLQSLLPKSANSIANTDKAVAVVEASRFRQHVAVHLQQLAIFSIPRGQGANDTNEEDTFSDTDVGNNGGQGSQGSNRPSSNAKLSFHTISTSSPFVQDNSVSPESGIGNLNEYQLGPKPLHSVRARALGLHDDTSVPGQDTQFNSPAEQVSRVLDLEQRHKDFVERVKIEKKKNAARQQAKFDLRLAAALRRNKELETELESLRALKKLSSGNSDQYTGQRVGPHPQGNTTGGSGGYELHERHRDFGNLAAVPDGQAEDDDDTQDKAEPNPAIAFTAEAEAPRKR